MSWASLPPHIQAAAIANLRPKQLDVFKLKLAGLGDRRIGVMLGVSRSTVRDHWVAAHHNLERAGVLLDASGRYYTKEAA